LEIHTIAATLFTVSGQDGINRKQTLARRDPDPAQLLAALFKRQTGQGSGFEDTAIKC
jgi:hypothetical protein